MSTVADDEILKLRTALRDLVAISTIPAAWVGREPQAIANGLADVLVGSLHLDFAFVRLCDPKKSGAVEVTRGNGWLTFFQWLKERSAAGVRFSHREIVSEIGSDGQQGRGIVIPIGINAEGGLVAAARYRADFPSDTEQLLLSVAANHAATAFQNARLIEERRHAEEALQQARDELEMKVAERTAELRRTTAELQTILNASPIGIALFASDWTVQRSNSALERIVGRKAEEIAGRPIPVAPANAEQWSALREKLNRGEAFANAEVGLLREDGSEFDAAVACAPLGDEPNAAAGFVGTIEDISDRKRAEEALHAALATRARLAALREEIGMTLAHEENLIGALHKCAEAMVRHLDAAFARIWTVSRDGRELRLQASAGMYTRLDGSYSQIPVGQAKIGIIAQERKPLLTDDVQNDPRVREKDWARREKMRSFAGYPLVLEDRVVGVMGMFSQKPLAESTCEALSFVADGIAHVIERKRAEEALRRSEAYLAEAQKLSHTGSWAFNLTGNHHWSEETFRIWGFDPRQGPPDRETVLQRIHAEDRDRVLEYARKATCEARDCAVEFRIVLPGGTVRHIYVLGHPVFSASGELVEVVGTHVDVTERKRAEEDRERLERLQTDLARINRVTTMGELTASLAHEINQPIAAVVTNARTCMRWLSRDVPEVEQAREAAARTVKDATRAAETISRVRALFKKGAPQRDLVDINAMIDDIVVLLRNEAMRHSVAIRTELAADIPKLAVDRVQLQQVFMNLMINSIEAMKAVDHRRELTLSSHRDGSGQLHISVADTGVGLPADGDQIFNAFFTTKPDGTGMGLAISRSIVEAHGGHLWATANSGRGATFHFTLPATLEAHA